MVNRFLAALLLPALLAGAKVDVQVSGNQEIPARKIEATLDLPENPGDMDESDWEVWSEDAAGLLSDLYREIGYFDAAFRFEHRPRDTAKAGTSAARDGEGRPDWIIKAFVREGSRYHFGVVDVIPSDSSAAVADPDDLRARYGRDFEQDIVFRDRRTLLNAYGDAGFLHARVSDRLQPDTLSKAVNLSYLVEPGPAVVFDTLMIRNLREGDSTGIRGVTRQRLLRKLAGMRRGDTVSLAGMGSFERKLRSTRVFNYVRIKDSLQSGGRSAMILSTEERVPGEMDVSVFYETQYGPGVGVNFTHGNLFGLLHEGRTGGSLAQKRQNAYLGYSSPLFFGTGFRFDYDLTTDWYQDSPQQESAGLFEGDFEIVNTGKVSRALADWCRLVGSTELRGLEYKTGPADTIRDFTLNFINSLYFSFVDNAVNPARGLRWSFTWGNGGQVFNRGELQVPTQRRHNWLELESAYYLPVHDRLKLAWRLDGGRFFDPGGSNSDRFFLGGPRSVRSFGWRKLCPDRNDSTGVCRQDGVEPIYYLASMEFRTSPFSPTYINPDGKLRHLLGLQVVPFVDYGRVWEVGEEPTPDGEGVAYGLGLRYALLSIFNVRVDFATDGPEFDNWQWVLDLAQAF